MARVKATITVDRAKLDEARAAIGAASASETIDVALSQLVRRCRRRRDVEAYSRALTEEESAVADPRVDWADLADDTDWEALWPEEG